MPAVDMRNARSAGGAIVYFDGGCALCNWTVARCLARGVPPGVRFAPRDGESFRRLTAVRPDLARLDSLVVRVLEPGESFEDLVAGVAGEPGEASSTARTAGERPLRRQILVRSQAVLWLAARLQGPERWFAWFARFVPRAVLDCCYRLLARNRQRVGRRLAACPVPTAEQRRHFLA